MKKFKIIVFITGLLPAIWYVYQIQGKLMAQQTTTKTVLDVIATPQDVLGVFPRTVEQMQDIVARVKQLTLQRLAAIQAVPAQERTFENTIRACVTP